MYIQSFARRDPGFVESPLSFSLSLMILDFSNFSHSSRPFNVVQIQISPLQTQSPAMIVGGSIRTQMTILEKIAGQIDNFHLHQKKKKIFTRILLFKPIKALQLSSHRCFHSRCSRLLRFSPLPLLYSHPPPRLNPNPPLAALVPPSIPTPFPPTPYSSPSPS